VYPSKPLFSPPSHFRVEVAPDSDHLDSEDEAPTGRKRKVSKAALEKQKAASKKRAKKGNDDDEYDDDGDEYTALSKSLGANKAGGSKPPIGSLGECAKCSKQFTMVRSLPAMSLASY
jgi:DNA repair protein RAD7